MSRYETSPQDQLSDSARNYILTKKPKLAAFVFYGSLIMSDTP